MGATNIARVLGYSWAIPVLLIDVLKGFGPVFLVGYFIDRWFLALASEGLMLQMLAGIFAMVGHIFPVWLRFKGGKGVATGLGVIIGLSPILAGSAIVIFWLTVFFSRRVSIGSLLSVLSLPFLFFIFFHFQEENILFWFLVGVVVLVWFMHRKNIKRILDGNEPKIGEKIYESKKEI